MEETFKNRWASSPLWPSSAAAQTAVLSASSSASASDKIRLTRAFPLRVRIGHSSA